MVKSSDIVLEKSRIRKETLAKLRSQSSFERKTKSAEIKKILFEDSAFNKSKCVMFYIPKDYEVDTRDMIIEALKQGKKAVVPVTARKERKIIPSEIHDIKEEKLEKGPFGIKQPKSEYIRPMPVDDIDTVIVPAVALDNSGNRIGHGKGYYDNFLKTLPKTALTIGVAFDFQIVSEVPSLSRDIPVKRIISA